ncbi:DNase I-like protein [Fistulina hepatica ATCC 64428]|nr:DNase I-like protein [Fistulina hepatica ATCC 64428]
MTMDDGVLVQIATYNTNLQGLKGLPQDLVDWLSPTLQVSQFLSRGNRAPDIVAVGFQELLPLHLGLAGLSKSVIEGRASHILSEIEAHAPNKEKYTLVAKIVNVGVALLIYALDEGIARYVTDVQMSWTGTGPLYMGNKGAVGIRFRVAGEDGGVGETYTFVCAHLTAHAPNLAHRIADFHHIVGTLLFPALLGSKHESPTTIYSTSHLFFFGDLNFRLDVPHILPNVCRDQMSEDVQREELKEYDQLSLEKRKGTIFRGFSEGEFWRFKGTYKYELGKVDTYSSKRLPAWTDRILYATYTDPPDVLGETGRTSSIKNLSYTSVPSYTTSDHKPVVSLLLMPIPRRSPAILPVLQLGDYIPSPDPWANVKRYLGRVADRVIGFVWTAFTFLGMGSAIVGIFNFVIGLAWRYWWRATSTKTPTPPYA